MGVGPDGGVGGSGLGGGESRVGVGVGRGSRVFLMAVGLMGWVFFACVWSTVGVRAAGTVGGPGSGCPTPKSARWGEGGSPQPCPLPPVCPPPPQPL